MDIDDPVSKDTIEYLMTEAFEMALEAYRVGEVPIGCVISSKSNPGIIIAKGRNRTNETRNGTRHAELEALDQVPSTSLSGSDSGTQELILAVTIEPCIMCTAVLRRLEGLTVFYGAANERFGGCGSVMNAHTCLGFKDVLKVQQVESQKARNVNLLRRFYLSENERAPAEKKKSKRKRVFKEML